jgi:cholesterol oxidase
MAFRDVVIIGSGFGGAVMAARLGEAAKAAGGKAKILVLEKGEDHSGAFDPKSTGGPLNAQGNRFRHSLAPASSGKVAQLFTDTVGAYKVGTPSMNVIAGIGVGGGSNAYDGVSLRAPTEAFDQARDGRRLWPALYSRAALGPYYAKVEEMLHVHRLAWTDAKVPHWQLATKRDFVFADGCRKIGATAVPLKLADEDDANEGWWNQGQRFSGRQNLSKNYLATAQGAGVELWSGCEVDQILPTATGYVVSGTDRRTATAVRFELECTLVVVAAGAVGSSGLLLRSKPAFTQRRALDPANMLGKQVSGNGDYGVTGVVGKAYEFAVEGHKGKPMSSFCPSFWREHQFILIPFYAAPLYLSLGQPSTLLPAKDPLALGRASTTLEDGARDWGLPFKQTLKSFGPRMLTMGCLALDACEGEVRLGRGGVGTEVAWAETTDATERRWSAAVDAMRRIYDALGGEMFLDGYRKDGTVSTAHPLGGCRMAEASEPSRGVVDPNGEVFGNPNLFVVDAAIVPSALGANPSLTIAAVAESIAERLVLGTGTKSFADRLG